jgi:hypothetical protein
MNKANKVASSSLVPNSYTPRRLGDMPQAEQCHQHQYARNPDHPSAESRRRCESAASPGAVCLEIGGIREKLNLS